jgi:hypothetical protein
MPSVPNDVVRLVGMAITQLGSGTCHAQGATGREIQSFESRYSVRLPDEYRTWLRWLNGPDFGLGGFVGINKVGPLVDLGSLISDDQYPEWRAAQFFPVLHDGCGNYDVIIASHPARPVGFVDTSLDSMAIRYLTASGLWPFIRFAVKAELGEEWWPSDKAKVLAEDPQLAECTGYPLPWDVADQP